MPHLHTLMVVHAVCVGLVRSGKNVLGERNIAFLHGPDHKALRKSFIALFTRKALGVYVGKQDAIIQRHLQVRWRAMQASTARTRLCAQAAAAAAPAHLQRRAWTHLYWKDLAACVHGHMRTARPCMHACKPAVVV